jgi:hypothetical protein
MEVLLRLAQLGVNRRDNRSARELARRALELAQPIEVPPEIMAVAHTLLGAGLSQAGKLEEAREQLEQAAIIRSSTEKIGSFGRSQLLVTGGSFSIVLALLGYPAAALAKSGDLLSDAWRVADPDLIAINLLTDAAVRMSLGDYYGVLKRAEELLSIGAQHATPFYVGMGNFCRGWALAFSGQAEGIAEIRRSMVAGQATGGLASAATHGFLAAACSKNSRPEQGLEAVAEGLAEVERADERVYEAEHPGLGRRGARTERNYHLLESPAPNS